MTCGTSLQRDFPLQTAPDNSIATRAWVQSLRASARAQSSLRNALYGAAEYIAMPATMLLATPFLLHRLGAAQYGLWMAATAAITSSSYISTGFGDAALKYAAAYRGAEQREKVEATLHVNLVINLALGIVVAIMIWYGAPLLVRRLFPAVALLQRTAVGVFRIASAILVVRSVESVFVAALRAYERYGPAVQINVLSRVATIVWACVLVARGRGVLAIMAATLTLAVVSAAMQMWAAHRITGSIARYSRITGHAFAEVFRFGCFSWMQTFAGCIFSYADRLVVGVLLGASSVAYYTVCVQAAQPIHGLIAAALHFTFPHLSARMTAAPGSETRPIVGMVLALNIALAILLCVPMVLGSKLILKLWMGAAFAQQTWMVLSIVAAGFGLLALNITGHYALLALEQVKLVAIVNILGSAAMLAGVVCLAPRYGLVGAAIGRLFYGPITLLMYFRLHSMLVPKRTSQAGLRRVVAIEEG